MSFDISGIDEMIAQFSKLGSVTEDVLKKAVKAGADPVADAIRSNLKSNLSGSKQSKGDLLDSFGITPADVDSNGSVNCKIGFSGYDRKGVANQLKARAMESGTSKEPKRPFIRPAVNSTEGKCIEAMQKVINSEIEKLI